jgi:arabinose-5-phosphate isomerase
MNDAADNQRLIEMGRDALRIEARAVAALVDRLGADFDTACRMLLACTGRVVVSGVGKSGHVGGRCGNPRQHRHAAFFLRPGEPRRPRHGDKGDVVPRVSIPARR